MKFPGELKFPELDHPGVPVDFLVEGNQAELMLEGESLGRWSLYDVRADRLIASAFLVNLAGTEITFVADDPIDFAYRGVEHMANSWAGIKAKRVGARGIAVSRSRRGTIPSRIDEVRAAMEDNLHVTGQKPLAGEPAMPHSVQELGADTADEPVTGDWDRRDTEGVIPAIGAEGSQPAPATRPAESTPEPLPAGLTEQELRLEQERRRLEQERAELERQRAEAEQREANLFEAYRLEMERLEAEREELRRQAGEAAQHVETDVTPAGAIAEDVESPAEPHPVESSAVRSEAESEPEPEAAEPEPEPVAAEPEPSSSEAEPVTAESEPATAESEPVGAEGRSVLDLNEFEHGRDLTPPPPPPPPSPPPRPAEPVPGPGPAPPPEPALAGAAKEKAGLMGAVRAAFRGGAKDHAHQFIEAPGGIGITRYVCEECGYVSISVGN